MKITELSTAYAKVHLPAKIALVATQKPDNGYNLITVEWFMRTSIQPPMFAISIGHNRFTHECLEEHRFFNLIFPSVEMKQVCAFSGSNSGKDVDKFAETDTKYIPGKLNKLPIPTEALAAFECEVTSQIRSGDHTIYIGEVKYSWVNAAKEPLIYQRKV